MLRIREAIVVEGRYDKNTLSQVVDTVIIETRGFGIFKDEERLSLLRRLAAVRRGENYEVLQKLSVLRRTYKPL